MKAYIRQARTLEERLEGTRIQVMAVDGRANLRSEHQPVIHPEVRHSVAFLKLALAVVLEGLERPGGQFEAPAALRGFGRCEDAIGERTLHLQRATLQIDVLPLQA